MGKFLYVNRILTKKLDDEKYQKALDMISLDSREDAMFSPRYFLDSLLKPHYDFTSSRKDPFDFFKIFITIVDFLPSSDVDSHTVRDLLIPCIENSIHDEKQVRDILVQYENEKQEIPFVLFCSLFKQL